MRQKLQQQLKDKYPSLFCDNPHNLVSMFGLEVGDGWYDLLDRTLGKLQEASTEDQSPILSQVKEKWGQLCIYLSLFTDRWEEIIDKAEAESAMICEECGWTGDLWQINGYWCCVCLECRETISRMLTSLPKNQGEDSV